MLGPGVIDGAEPWYWLRTDSVIGGLARYHDRRGYMLAMMK
ncbi:hypothetical protein DFJ65_0310 [Calidifontibacter indicus]|uniref:Uncharacterized protein n=1 Tax=Calidifontibacter indicus TaxID=419650 RepID=A0A3D9UN14_9MICO|nr:hypothetical protein DFJ65_0310 [Calidifontibacter indicus]